MLPVSVICRLVHKFGRGVVLIGEPVDVYLMVMITRGLVQPSDSMQLAGCATVCLDIIHMQNSCLVAILCILHEQHRT